MKKPFRHIAVLLAVLVLFPGCGGLKGEFAFRKPPEDIYKKVEGVPEFSAGDVVDWVYAVPEVSGSHVVGIALMKKEMVWVDVSVRTENLNETQKVIYGRIENLQKGSYRIVLAENGKIIEEKEFMIYDDDEGEDEEFPERQVEADPRKTVQ